MGRTQRLQFCSILGPNLPPEKQKFANVNGFQGKNLSIKIKAPSPLNFQWKIQLLFSLFVFFREKMGLGSKIKRSQVRLTLLFEMQLVKG